MSRRAKYRNINTTNKNTAYSNQQYFRDCKYKKKIIVPFGRTSNFRIMELYIGEPSIESLGWQMIINYIQTIYITHVCVCVSFVGAVQ